MKLTVYLLLIFFLQIDIANAQKTDSLLRDANLQNCVQYALKHQPAVNQSLIDEQITDREIKSKLADWLPQLNLNANYQNNFHLQSAQFGAQLINIGTYNSSSAQFALTQTIFNRDVLLAKTSEKDVRTGAKQLTTNTRIYVAANVTKAFYDVLLSIKKIELLDEDIVLLDRSMKDAYNQYKGGLVDKTDYQRATIALNNSKAQKKNGEEELKIKYATLKLLMSYPPGEELHLVYDSLQLANEAAAVDTLENLNLNNRIEYQLMLTQKKLQEANIKYYKWGFLPSLSAFGQYNFNYLNNEFSKLYSQNYPNSYAGLSLSFPIFQGTKRIQQLRIAQLQMKRLDYDFVALRDSISAQYTQALAVYKSNLTNFQVQRENLALAKEVYDIIQLQYRSGIKTYLDVVTANNDLFLAQINYTNAVYQVLINKVDVELALGTLQY
ncbi:MAG: TolC family protein [Bacteroidetes bacterium]|nr:TolC family protein [Bacteroidota bacterium]